MLFMYLNAYLLNFTFDLVFEIEYIFKKWIKFASVWIDYFQYVWQDSMDKMIHCSLVKAYGVRHQAIIWTNAGTLSIRPLWKHFTEIVFKI